MKKKFQKNGNQKKVEQKVETWKDKMSQQAKALGQQWQQL